MKKNGPARVPAQRQPGWLWFLAWLLTGAGFAAAVATLLSVGPFILPLALAAAALLLWRGPARASFGMVSGAGVLLLCIAYLNRHGPGTVCTATNGGQTCTDEYTPWPLFASGLLLLLTGPILFQLRQRTARL